ncbi:MAG: tRNA (adenosine(37)-N6)-threonylcarbamoyltransferase complex ATPase subunit type 1 TsaE [Chloroflexota bacterium]
MSQSVSAAASGVRFASSSAEMTLAIASDLATAAWPGDLICLWGDLGAGKTVVAKGFGAGLGVHDTINSPTFVLMAEYEGRLPLFHLDLYRLAGADDAYAGGLLDERQAAGVTLIEWPERFGDALPSDRLDVRIDGTGDDVRHISISATTPSLARYLAAVRTDIAAAPPAASEPGPSVRAAETGARP